MWNLKRNDTNDLPSNTERDSQTQKGQLGSWDGPVHPAIFKMDNQQGPTDSTQISAQCYVSAWMGEGFGGEWIHVYVWLNLFPVHWKLSQHC